MGGLGARDRTAVECERVMARMVARLEADGDREKRERDRQEAKDREREASTLVTPAGVILLHFMGPPVPITARMHSTPQRPFPL